MSLPFVENGVVQNFHSSVRQIHYYSPPWLEAASTEYGAKRLSAAKGINYAGLDDEGFHEDDSQPPKLFLCGK